MSFRPYKAYFTVGSLSIALCAVAALALIPGTTSQAGSRYSNPAPETFLDPNVDGPVYKVAVQPDGRILIGGNFDNVAGQRHTKVARLNADGSLDTSFVDADVRPDGVDTLKLLSDGKVLIGGRFTAVGIPANGGVTGVARLNSNGTFDPFYPVAPGGMTIVEQQADGNILLGGYFTNVFGVPRRRLARVFNSDWNLDTSFQDPGLDGPPRDIAIQPDGKIIVCGAFSTLNGVSRYQLARLNIDGSLDTTFTSPVNPIWSASVRAIELQPDGKLVIGGNFRLGDIEFHLARLNSDGTIDATFRKPDFDDDPYALAVDANGKVLVGGWFNTVDGQLRSKLLRLNSDGTLDASFPNPRVGADVYSIAVQSDGKIVIGGTFQGVQGWTRKRVARLNPDGSIEGNPPAVVLNVTKTADTNDGACDADCSLREAIAAAPANNELTRIGFDAGVFGSPQTITLSSGELFISTGKRIELVGPGPALLTVSGNNASRVLRIGPTAPTTVSGITLSQGNGAGPIPTNGDGGAVYVHQDNDNTTFTNCAIVQSKGSRGGGIYMSSGVTLSGSTVANNEATNITGGGIHVSSGALNVINSTVRDNFVSSSISAVGGGIYNSSSFGSIALTNSTISGNTARTGGGVAIEGSVLQVNNTLFENNVASDGSGGGIFVGSGTLAIADSTFRLNRVLLNGTGGGLFNVRAGTIVRTAFDQNSAPNGGGLSVSAANATADGLIITANAATAGSGGALFINQSSTAGQNFVLSNSTVSGNTATSFGGAILNRSTLVVNNSSISNNTSGTGGGALMNSAVVGVANATFNRSLIDANRSNASGGAIQNQAGVVNLINSTMSGNYAQGFGGGVHISQSGVLNLSFSTIAFNSGGSTGGITTSSSTINSHNSIIANNIPRNSGAQVSGPFVSQGYNLLGQSSGATITGDTMGNILDVDPQLEPTLSVNAGGQTRLHRLRSNSPALDRGKSAIGPVTVDQRGLARPIDNPSIPNAEGGDGADIGAFEKQAADVTTARSPFDFDGDGKTDIGIFRPAASGGEWWVNRSSTGATLALQFGASTDKVAPGDYTGDGKTDIAFFRPASGEWYVLRSEDFSFFAFPFGTAGDIPVTADYDADAKADPAVFRPSTATWYISRSGGGATRTIQFGVTGDQPIAADYDGDGRADIAIFRPAPGGAEWWINRSTAGVLAMQFGASTDKPVQGDYTGDGKTDIAIWKPASGEWFIVRSEDFSFYGFPFGANGDVIAPGDYDGDGKFDPTVFRPASATWFIARTTAGTQIVQFGANGDRPLPNAFVP